MAAAIARGTSDARIVVWPSPLSAAVLSKSGRWCYPARARRPNQDLLAERAVRRALDSLLVAWGNLGAAFVSVPVRRCWFRQRVPRADTCANRYLCADLLVYFAHAHSPWERGTNENTNGVIR